MQQRWGEGRTRTTRNYWFIIILWCSVWWKLLLIWKIIPPRQYQMKKMFVNLLFFSRHRPMSASESECFILKIKINYDSFFHRLSPEVTGSAAELFSVKCTTFTLSRIFRHPHDGRLFALFSHGWVCIWCIHFADAQRWFQLFNIRLRALTALIDDDEFPRTQDGSLKLTCFANFNSFTALLSNCQLQF